MRVATGHLWSCHDWGSLFFEVAKLMPWRDPLAEADIACEHRLNLSSASMAERWKQGCDLLGWPCNTDAV